MHLTFLTFWKKEVSWCLFCCRKTHTGRWRGSSKSSNKLVAHPGTMWDSAVPVWCPVCVPSKGFTNSRRLCSKYYWLTDRLWISYRLFFDNHCLAVTSPGVSHSSVCNTEDTCSYWDTKHICQKKILINKVWRFWLFYKALMWHRTPSHCLS